MRAYLWAYWRCLNPCQWGTRVTFSSEFLVLLERAKVGQRREQPSEQQQHKQPRIRSLALVECWARSNEFILWTVVSNSSRETLPSSDDGNVSVKPLDKPKRVMFPLPRITIGSIVWHSSGIGLLFPLLLLSISSIMSSKSWCAEEPAIDVNWQ